jgi:hypothetical protein
MMLATDKIYAKPVGATTVCIVMVCHTRYVCMRFLPHLSQTSLSSGTMQKGAIFIELQEHWPSCLGRKPLIGLLYVLPAICMLLSVALPAREVELGFGLVLEDDAFMYCG